MLVGVSGPSTSTASSGQHASPARRSSPGCCSAVGERAPDIERRRFRVSTSLAWHGTSADEVATLCERRIGLKVDAAAPATVVRDAQMPCILALAATVSGCSRTNRAFWHPHIGRVLAYWDGKGLVAHVERSRHGERFEFSWPRRGALVCALMPHGHQPTSWRDNWPRTSSRSAPSPAASGDYRSHGEA